MIPAKLRKELENDNFWNKPCIHSGDYGVQAEHTYLYSGKSLQFKTLIVPVAPRFNYNPNKQVKSYSRYYALLQTKRDGEWENLKSEYPRINWEQELETLTTMFE